MFSFIPEGEVYIENGFNPQKKDQCFCIFSIKKIICQSPNILDEKLIDILFSITSK